MSFAQRCDRNYFASIRAAESRRATREHRVNPSRWCVWLDAARPRTLPAAVAPVLVGAALAARDGSFDWIAVALCVGFALLIQIGTNFANDYYDFIRGADTAERVGPTRAVAAGLVAPAVMHRAIGAVFAAAFVGGTGYSRGAGRGCW